jgi:D-threo-aldose 1-dehydrogenase
MMPSDDIGTISPSVSKLAFGGAPVGNLYTQVSDADAEQAIAAVLAAGMRHFDTAPHYGLGLSEHRLGRALAGQKRDTFTISTKVGRLLVPNSSPSGSDEANGFAVPDDLCRVLDYSRDGVRRSITESLGRLHLDYVDVALVHDPDDVIDQAISETIPALLELRQEGVVRSVGAGMNQWPALTHLVKETDVDVVMVAGRWTLLDRSALPLLDVCHSRSVAVLAAAPFNSGILASGLVSEDARFNYGRAEPARIDAARRLADICRRHDVELATAALQFPVRHPAVTTVVCGMRSASEVRTDASLFTAPVPEACWIDLQRESPA